MSAFYFSLQRFYSAKITNLVQILITNYIFPYFFTHKKNTPTKYEGSPVMALATIGNVNDKGFFNIFITELRGKDNNLLLSCTIEVTA